MVAEATPQFSRKQTAEAVVEVPDTVPASEEEIRKSVSGSLKPAPTSPTPSHNSSLSLGASASGLNSSQAHEVEPSVATNVLLEKFH